MNTNENIKTEAEASYEHGLAAAGAKAVLDKWGRELGVYVVPAGGSVKVLHEYAEPVIDVDKMFRTVASFLHYAARFLEPETAFLQMNGEVLTAVFDYHGAGAAGTCSHKAQLVLRASPELQAWEKIDGRWLSQGDFARHLEAFGMDAEDPAALIEVARTLKAESKVKFERGERLDNGDVALTFHRETKARAGERGELEVPEGFVITVPLFEGQDVGTPIEVRLRYRIGEEGDLAFSIDLLRLERVRLTALDSVRREVERALAVAVYL